MLASCSSDIITPRADISEAELGDMVVVHADRHASMDVSDDFQDSNRDIGFDAELDMNQDEDAHLSLDLSITADMWLDDMSDADAGFELPFEYKECECEDPLAVCSNNRCHRPDVRCPENTCPEGYICQEDLGYCICASEYWNEPTCWARCQTPSDCPHPDSYCGPDRRCHRVSTCTTDYQCPHGLWCVRGSCVPPGAKADGEACSYGSDCQSGSCYLGTCDVRCSIHSDCPDGYFCNRHNFNICTQDDPQCTTTCGINENCYRDRCEPAHCNSGEDCHYGDCHIPPAYGVGECIGETKKCKDNEVKSRHYPNDPYCRTFQQCNPTRSNECPSPYTCESDGAEGNPYHRYLCSRLP